MIRVYRRPNETLEHDNDEVKYLSIDPAIKNFAIRIERRCNGMIEPLLFELIKLGSGKREKVENVIINLHNYLVSKIDLMSNVRIVLVETQMDKTPMIKIQHHLIAFFMHHPIFSNTYIIEVSPKLKSSAFGCPKGLNKYALKRWSVEKAKQICIENNDELSHEILCSHKKTKKNNLGLKDDDLADTIVMLEAFLLKCEESNE
jgi:hypothetical protein